VPELAVLQIVTTVACAATIVLNVHAYRRWRRELDDLTGERTALIHVRAALMRRATEWPCEVCGRPFDDEAVAVLRLGPDGTDVLAHPFCLSPIPETVA
jgi:hypothetical protein